MEEKNKAVSRNQLHGQIMTCIYQYLFYAKFEEKPDIKSILTSVFGPKIDEYAKKTVIEVLKHANEAIESISPKLNKYRFERLSLVEQAILILAYTENMYLEQPKPIAINVSVKLAQKFCDAESYKFINAVLEQVLKND